MLEIDVSDVTMQKTEFLYETKSFCTIYVPISVMYGGGGIPCGRVGVPDLPGIPGVEVLTNCTGDSQRS